MSLELTEPQQHALDVNGPPLRLIDPRSQVEYVLIPAEQYERFDATSDETVFTTAEMLDRVMAEDDANDPYLQDYQRIYGDKSS